MPIILQSGAKYGEDSGKSDLQRALAKRERWQGEQSGHEVPFLPKKTPSRVTNEDVSTSGTQETSNLLTDKTGVNQAQEKKVKKKRTGVGKLAKYVKTAYKKLGLKHMIPLLLIVIYCLFGAILFQLCEYDNDLQARMADYNNYHMTREMFIARMDEISRVGKPSLAEITEAVDYYDSQIARSFSNESVWHFWNSMYFAGTIFTTIGYGNIACVTTLGQVMTMLYALFGIPLLLSSLNDIGKALFRLLHRSITIYDNVLEWVNIQWNLHRPNRSGIRTPSSIHSDVEYEMMEAGTNSKQLRKTVSAPVDGAAFVSKDNSSHEDKSSSPAMLPLSQQTKEKEKEPPSDDESKSDDLIEELEEEFDAPPVKIPLILAAGTTIGWVVFVSLLFCIWEDWTIFTSFYFFFISLSTIGLGDVTPEHTKLMVFSFGFVIIGLSLVSMLINVIQQRLEDLYLSLLLMILDEYTREMHKGNGDQVGASIGMMQVWGQSKKAKFLLPLMGSDKKARVMTQFTKEAKAQGIELPAILTHMDKSGMPAILSVKKVNNEEIESMRQKVKEVINKAETEVIQQSAPIEPKPAEPAVITYDGITQTEDVILDEKCEQTLQIDSTENTAQTDSCAWFLIDNGTQTQLLKFEENETQTTLVDYLDEEVQSVLICSDESSSQTIAVVMQDQELQSHVCEYVEVELQTEPEETPELINHRVQTDPPTLKDQQSQAQPEIKEPETSTSDAQVQTNKSTKSNLTRDVPVQTEPMISRIKKHIKQCLADHIASNRRCSAPDLQYLEELGVGIIGQGESDDSIESLGWDPIDGLHAEKQRKVTDLRAMFNSGGLTRQDTTHLKKKPNSRRSSTEPSQKFVRPGDSSLSHVSPSESLRRESRTSPRESFKTNPKDVFKSNHASFKKK